MSLGIKFKSGHVFYCFGHAASESCGHGSSFVVCFSSGNNSFKPKFAPRSATALMTGPSGRPYSIICFIFVGNCIYCVIFIGLQLPGVFVRLCSAKFVLLLIK